MHSCVQVSNALGAILSLIRCSAYNRRTRACGLLHLQTRKLSRVLGPTNVLQSDMLSAHMFLRKRHMVDVLQGA